MKKFLLFYSTIIIIVFCLMSHFTNDEIFIFDETTEITVTINGAVVERGLSHTVSTDTYLIDVIALSGGLRDSADKSQINLYQKVTNKTYTIPYGIINVQTGDSLELEDLTGIGATTASNIIEYRQSNPFLTVDDFALKWSSIYYNNQDRITV